MNGSHGNDGNWIWEIIPKWPYDDNYFQVGELLKLSQIYVAWSKLG